MLSLVLFSLIATGPIFAAAPTDDVTLPIAGYAQGANDVRYRTELTITNHRDQLQYIEISQIQNGYAAVTAIFPLDPLETSFHCCDTSHGDANSEGTYISAWRFRTLLRRQDGSPGEHDPDGRIEVDAFIVAERGRFGNYGSSRQEIAGIPSSDYTEEEAVFLGVRHSPNTDFYTNVGIVNMHPTQTETFFVRFQQEQVPVVVPPNSLRQIRIPGDGGGWRFVRVVPEWALTDEAPPRTTPWVAYTSSIDTRTGDAFSGKRVPPGTRYDFPGPD